MTAIVNVSSLYPIDATAAICHGLAQPHDDLTFAVNDLAAFDEQSPYRRHVARAAVPTCRWLRDRRGTWRQLHEPLSYMGCNTAPQALSGLEASIVDRLKEIAPGLSAGVSARCARLSRAGAADATWPDTTASLIQLVATEVLGRGVRVARWSEMLTELEDDGAVAEFVGSLAAACESSPTKAIGFTRGGYIEARADGRRWRFRGCRIGRSGALEFVDLTGEKGILATRAVDLRFGGPLENGLLATRYTLVDHAWFALGTAADPGLERATIEYISPPVAHDCARTSIPSGGEGLRLDPLGYTLLDYLTPEVGLLMQALLDLPAPVRSPDVEPWCRLLQDFPSTSQKAAKDQRSVRAYRHLLEQACLREFASAPISQLGARLEAGPSAFELGDQLVRLIAVLGVWRRRIVESGEQVGAAHGSDFYPLDLAVELAAQTITWLCRWGDRPSDVLAMNATLATHVGECHRAKSTDEWSRLVGGCIRVLRRLAERYFGFALFFSTAVLKATPILLYVLLGGEKSRAVLQQLLATAKRERLFFERTLWRIIDVADS